MKSVRTVAPALRRPLEAPSFRRLIGLVLAAAALATPARAETLRALPDGVEVRSGDLVEQVTALRDDVVRVRVGAHGTLPEDASWAVLPAARTARATVTPTATGFATKDVVVRLDAVGGRLTIEDRSGHTILAGAPDRPLSYSGRSFEVRQVLPVGERIYGLGDKAGPLDRRGQAFSMWNTDAYGYQDYSDPLYKSIPFFLGVSPEGRSYGLLLDDTWRSWFDFGRTDPRVLTFGAEDGPLDYYVLAGPTPKDVVEAYAWLTGPSPLPPLWTLGFQQSRYSYMSDTEVRGIADRFRRERIPADAIYLDIDYQDRNRPFTVNPVTFPDLPRLVSDLKRDGFRLVAITDLHIADAPNQGYAPYDTGASGDQFVKAADGQTYVGPVWPGPAVFPDFTRASTRAWWGGLYKEFHAAGIAGFWNDMNEPAIFETPTKTMPLDVVHRIDEPGFAPRTATHAEIHNVYGMQNSRATYEGLLTLAPDERPFVLTRASYAGGQRYAATWTGDNSSTWSHLALSVAMQLNLGVSGFAWSGADVGGFADSPAPELLTKWIEIAAFTPLFRDHAAKGTRPHEPWVDGPAQTDLRRRFIEERYRLAPYLYALADETARTGLPVMRPIYLEFPQALEQDGLAAFLLGPDLLVAPPTNGETLDTYTVSLPGRGWFDYWSGRPVASWPDADLSQPGVEIVRETPSLARLPVFVRPGAILPRQPLVQSLAQTPEGRLELRVYPGPNCRGQLYWDDGRSRRRDAAAVLRQTIHCEATATGLTLRFEPRRGGFPPWWRGIHVAVYGWRPGATTARLDGQPVPSTYAPDPGVLSIDIADQPGPAVLSLQSPTPRPAPGIGARGPVTDER
jgi:alpha-glucosidase